MGKSSFAASMRVNLIDFPPWRKSHDLLENTSLLAQLLQFRCYVLLSAFEPMIQLGDRANGRSSDAGSKGHYAGHSRRATLSGSARTPIGRIPIGEAAKMTEKGKAQFPDPSPGIIEGSQRVCIRRAQFCAGQATAQAPATFPLSCRLGR
jgi:hypothetical protein